MAADDEMPVEPRVESPVETVPASPDRDAEVRDALPSDLDVTGFVGPYKFPDNSRRRIPGIIYLVIAALCVVAWLLWNDSGSGLVNGGFLLAAGLLTATGIYSITSGWKLGIDEKQALVAATRQVGFPVGHASAQLAWRGLRSRPTWRILLYSVENPPRRRGLVLVDAVDGRVVEHLVEDNPEQDWVEPDL
jgi:hypothetical protein